MCDAVGYEVSCKAFSGCFCTLRAILRSTQNHQPRSRSPDSAPRTLLGWARETCTGVPPMPQASQRGFTRPSSLLSPDHIAFVRLSFFLAMATPLLLCLLALAATSAAADVGGTIGFATVGRMNFHFDVYTLTLPAIDTLGSGAFEETRVTLGESVSYNAQLVQAQWDSAVVESLRRHGHDLQGSEAPELLVYVSEVEGTPQLYLDIPLQDSKEKRFLSRPIALREADGANGSPKVYLNDRPSMNGDIIIFVSTEEDVGKRLQGWNAVYSLDFKTSVTKRLTPPGITDYSPAISPSGEWVAAVSNEGRGWKREIEALDLDLYVFKAEDGSQRRMVVRNAGWPTWADESTVYFHRLADDGWWSIFKVNASDPNADQEAERVTPPGVHAFTPAASRTGKWIAVATRRTSIRHIEIFDLEAKKFLRVTAHIHPSTHHYNPFVLPSSKKIGYHRCRGVDEGDETVDLRVEHQKSPIPDVSVVRVEDSFPAVSPDGSLIAHVDSNDRSAGLVVMELDGSQKRVVWNRGKGFGINWDPTGKGVVYVSAGRGFASVNTQVSIIAVQNADTADLDADETSSSFTYLTKEGTKNNAFPAPSPDGKYVVFRSSRSGYKNLYIMDAVHGEEKYLRRLTEGPWGDTMPAWSPNNEWIAFASNRVHPTGERSYNLYLVHPNGTGLHMLLDTGIGGLAMHPHFSPDGKKIVFASDWAGVSAEPISVPHQYQPYGEIFVINVDGTGLTRVTHNAYENGTPTWGILPLSKAAVSKEGKKTACAFDDVRFLNNSTAQGNLQALSGQCQRRWDPYVHLHANVPCSHFQKGRPVYQV